MGKQSNVIIINGMQYDAHTGALIENQKPVLTSSVRPGTMDFAPRKRNQSIRPSAAVTSNAIHAKHGRSQTLRRGTVRKPHLLKATNAAVTSESPVQTKSKQLTTSFERSRRAQSVQKSHHVSKFSPSATSSISVSTAPIGVTVAPQRTTNTPNQKVVQSTQPNTDFSALSKALAKAESHQLQPLKKATFFDKLASTLKISPRLASIGTTTFAVALLAGFFVYQNIPNLAVRVAAARSGVDANLPGYKPAGFAINGPIQYSAGSISIPYSSNSDTRNFVVTQKTSNWNSETLLTNHVAVDRRPYQTYQGQGKTIYVYNESSATWVDKGIWYQIDGDSSLNSEQLIRLANSL